MVSIVEVEERVPGDTVALVNDLSEAVTQRNAAAAAAAAGGDKGAKPDAKQDTGSNADNIPEKLRGKSLQEVASMYQNLESRLGHMANDLGTQRKLTDRLLDLKRAEDLGRNQPEPPKVDRSKLLEDPTAEMDRFLSAREAQRGTETTERLAQLEVQLATQAFVQKHPDVQTIAQDPQFNAWVSASPIRKRAAALAANGDWSAADDLLTEFKSERQNGSQNTNTNSGKTAAEAQAEAVEAARRASLEGSGGGSGNPGGAKGKVYRRADLLELKLRKPETYYDPAFQDEILAAYNEGRVK